MVEEFWVGMGSLILFLCIFLNDSAGNGHSASDGLDLFSDSLVDTVGRESRDVTSDRDINVEFTTRTRFVKYMFKYMYSII